MCKKLRDERGFTLVEVLVSIVLLSLGILTAITLLNVGVNLNDQSNEKTEALKLAGELIDQYKHKSVSDTGTLMPESSYTRGGKVYKAIVTADQDPDNNIDQGVLITVKVWTTDISKPLASLSTLVKKQ